MEGSDGFWMDGWIVGWKGWMDWEVSHIETGGEGADSSCLRRAQPDLRRGSAYRNTNTNANVHAGQVKAEDMCQSQYGTMVYSFVF